MAYWVPEEEDIKNHLPLEIRTMRDKLTQYTNTTYINVLNWQYEYQTGNSDCRVSMKIRRVGKRVNTLNVHLGSFTYYNNMC